MERIARKPLQGITNIIRFNWHFYVMAGILLIILSLGLNYLPAFLFTIAFIFLLLTTAALVVSLLISWYVYDYAGIYSLSWLDNLDIGSGEQLVNINAGFDETSLLLRQKYASSTLKVFDFYDPVHHTEISIERARKAYPAYPGTIKISTNNVPLPADSIDYIFLIFAAHEIRDEKERIEFFRQLGTVLKAGGKIIVTEHQRDIPNFIAYTIGFFHFFSPAAWKRTFARADLRIDSSSKLTPFITTFVLTKNGTAS
jgi:SAM-dependent methyltransferase